jgi:hypothetical protein
MTSGLGETPELVPIIEPTSCYQTLGVHLSPSSSTTEAFQILKQQTIEYSTALIGS